MLNVTPDSFSDGGRYLETGAAVARAKEMLAQGADVIDVGGASSRPPGQTYGAGAEVVPVEIEIARVVPVIEVITRELGAKVSIDTSRGAVAEAALAAGASIVNDVSMGRDPALLAATARHRAELVLMHTRGHGQLDAETTAYRDLVRDVAVELEHACERARIAGVRDEAIWADPGLGFAKTADQSATVLANLHAFFGLGAKILVGASRKSFLGALSEHGGVQPGPEARLTASLAAVVIAADAGAHAVRVHDVAETRALLDVLARVASRREALGHA